MSDMNLVLFGLLVMGGLGLLFGAVLATGVSPVIGIALMLPYWMSRKCGFHIVE